MVLFDAFGVIFGDSASWMPQFVRHAQLSIVALVLSIAIAIPLGALLTRIERVAFTVISIANLGRTIPSLALLALVYPFVGTGFLPSLIALVAMGMPPILLSTYTGIREVDPNIPEAARGMGMSEVEQLLYAELPAAAPIIVSGTRTSAVQIVASATLAALIGGGGLGELILAGLTNLRFDLLIAGALLVAVLASLTELGFSLLERRGLPAGIRTMRELSVQTSNGYRAGASIDARRWLTIGGASCAGAACIAFAGLGLAGVLDRAGSGVASAHDGPLPTVTIGTKDFTEQLVLGELYAQALETQGYPVERKFNLGATAVADAALTRGDIDLYPEYTGTALYAVLKQKPPRNTPTTLPLEDADARSAEVYRTVAEGYSKRGMTLFAETPFSNGNAIVVTKDVAERYDLMTMSDLAKVAARLKFGAVPGFDAREDGMPVLKREYGMKFGEVKTFEIGLKYKALLDSKIDAVYGFETDGQIAQHDLVVLEDDRHAWPPYHAVPVVNAKFAAGAGPALPATINSVTRLLDSATMQELNNFVDHDKQDPADVARTFLTRHGLLETGPRPAVTIGSKDFTEQFILAELYAQALEARGFPVTRRLNLGATAVADTALKSGQIDMYPEYTGTALTAVLKGTITPGQSGADVYAAVEKGYRKRGMTTLAPTAFSNGNAIVMTKEAMQRHDIETLTDLGQVSGDLRFGAIPGFDTREDGLPMLKREYGVDFASVKTFEIGLKYKALLDGKVDAVYGFETDGQIAQHGLVVVQDDKRIWPPYQVTPVVSGKLAKEVGPEFAATVDTVTGLLDTDTMRKLNDRVDRDKLDPEDVAHAFLDEHGLA